MTSCRIFLIVFLLLFVSLSVAISQQLTWDKKYFYPNIDQSYFYKMLQIENSDLYLAGYAEFGWFEYSPGFMRIDTNGNMLWAKTYNIPDAYKLITHTLLQASENSYYSFCFDTKEDIIIKQKAKWPESTNDCWLLKLDSNGDTLFSKHFDEIGWVNDLILDNDKLVAVGSTNYMEEIQGINCVFSRTTILVLDTNGTFLWRKEFMIDEISRANSIIKNEMGNYLITGTTTYDSSYFGYINYPENMYLLETDLEGNLLSEFHSDTDYSEGKQILECEDDNYAVIGDGWNNTENHIDIILWKFDTELNPISNVFSEIPRADEAYRFKQIPDGGFIICGSVVPLSSPYWSPAFFYMKTDVDGTLEWYLQNESPNNCAYDLLINNTSGYYFAGESSNRARLVKTDLEGNGMIVSIDPDEKISNDNEFKVFPNPGDNEIIIIGSESDPNFNLTLIDLFGNELINTVCFANQWNVNTTKLPKGLYYYKISRNEKILQSGKWIKE